MATAKTAKIMYESGQSLFDYTESTTSDQIVHTVTGKTIFSGKDGFTPEVRPDGIVTGRNLLSTHATNNTVTVAAFTAYLAGTLHTVAATTALAVRGASDVAKICSIQLDSDGSTINVVEGTDSASAALSETRGAAGGPPFVVVGDIEIGQVRFTGNTAAAVLSSEIHQTVGTHATRFDVPAWSVNNIGDGDAAETSAQKNAYVKFDSAISDGIYTGGAYKPVYISGYTPILSELRNSVDFVPAENTHSLTSTEVYNNTIGASSSSLGAASFTVKLEDGITDGLVANKDNILTFKTFPNRSKLPYMLTQGLLGMATTYPVSDLISAACTISAERKTALFAS